MRAFVDFSQTLSSRHIKMRINLTSLKGIFIINCCLETAGFKFNCLVPLYKSIVSRCRRGENGKEGWGLMHLVKEGIRAIATSLPYYNSLRTD